MVTITLPKEYSSGEMFGNDEKFDPCKMYALHETGIVSENSITNVQCHSESFDNGTVMACESYVYDKSIFPETLTTSFNLVSKVVNLFKYIQGEPYVFGRFLKVGVASKWVKPHLQNFLCFLSIIMANFPENLVTIA